MKNWICIITFISLIYFQSTSASTNRELEIYKNIRCLVCQGQSIHDSNSDFAKDLKQIIKNKIDANESNEIIYQYLADRYGDWILFNPPIKKTTLLLWLIPFSVLIIIAFALYKKTIFKRE